MADYSNSKSEITRLSDYIYKITPYEGIELTAEDVRELRIICLRFSGNRPFAVLLDASHNFTPTEEARKLLASEEYTDLRIAAAFVTSSLANKLFGNFFIRFNRPATPTRLFSDEAAALRWLEALVKAHYKK
jgi:hypothetical protein